MVASLWRSDDLQAAVVDPLKPHLHGLEEVVEPAVLDLVVGFQEAAAQHRRERQRHESRHQDGRHDRHRELVQEPAENSAHEQHGNKHGRERQRHGKNRKTDLPRTVDGGLHHAFSLLHVAHDVFQHHDRVIHDEAHGERQRHQRKVVERIAAQVHHGESAHEGKRQRQAGNRRRRKIPQEEEDDHDHQEKRQLQRELHVVHRVANRDRAVEKHAHLDGRRQRRLQTRKHGLDAVHHLHGVRARLLKDDHRDGGYAVRRVLRRR